MMSSRLMVAAFVAVSAFGSTGCGKSKFKASLDAYNHWVSHSNEVSHAINDIAKTANGGVVLTPHQQAMQVQGVPLFGVNVNHMEVPESQLTALDRLLTDYQVPDRATVDSRLVEKIDEYTAIGKEVVPLLRAYNRVIAARSSSADVAAAIDKINSAQARLSVQGMQIEQTLEQIARDSKQTLTRK